MQRNAMQCKEPAAVRRPGGLFYFGVELKPYSAAIESRAEASAALAASGPIARPSA